VVAVPFLGLLSPVWVPVPEPVLPAVAVAEPPVHVLNTRMPVPMTAEWPDAFEPLDASSAPAPRPESPAATEARPQTPVAAPEVSVTPPPVEPGRAFTWTLADGLVAAWLLGAVACVLRSLVGLAFLARCRRRSAVLTDAECLACLQELVQRAGIA